MRRLERVLDGDGDTHLPEADGALRLLADDERHALTDSLYREARQIRSSDPVRLAALAEQALDLATRPDTDGSQYLLGTARALSLLAYHDAEAGDSEAAISRASQALALVDTSEPAVLVADLFEALGWALFLQGEFVEALQVLVSAIDVSRKIGDREIEAQGLNLVARIDAASGRANEALEGQLEALAVAESTGDTLLAAGVKNDLAHTYLLLGDTNAALEMALSALRRIDERDLDHQRIPVLDTIASVFLARGELEPAAEYAERALDLAREGGTASQQCDNLMTLGQIAIKFGDLDLAQARVQEALHLAERAKRAVEEYTCHEILARIYERRGDMAAALAEYHTFHNLERRRFNEENETRLAHLRIEHQLDSARKDAEIHRLRNLALEREVAERRVAQARLEAQASLDPLTGLYNRRHLEVLEEELSEAGKRGESACLLLFDIDRFKEINDSLGHLAGDRVLVSIASVLSRYTRSGDVPCRYGGDEFLVLLLGMTPRRGLEAAERFRARIAEQHIDFEVQSLSVTISAGIACTSAGGKLDDLIARADAALYAAKQAGRDRVVAG